MLNNGQFFLSLSLISWQWAVTLSVKPNRFCCKQPTVLLTNLKYVPLPATVSCHFRSESVPLSSNPAPPHQHIQSPPSIMGLMGLRQAHRTETSLHSAWTLSSSSSFDCHYLALVPSCDFEASSILKTTQCWHYSFIIMLKFQVWFITEDLRRNTVDFIFGWIAPPL